MASVSISSITSNSCFVRLTGLDTAYSRNDRQVDYYFNNEWMGYENLDAYISRSDGVDIEDLEPDTRYSVEAVVNFASGSPIYLNSSFRTEIGRPEKFYWIDSRNDLTDLPKGVLIENYITASLWRELQNNVNDVREYKGYRSYSFSRVSRGDPILADDYNDIVSAIKGISGYGSYLSYVSEGDIITRRIMQRLQDELNAIE
ncbi:MAG: hypothetical protein HFE57_08415 [Firmicutes bacterium]|nr:hypothetical protein [Bacillota bacterium]